MRRLRRGRVWLLLLLMSTSTAALRAQTLSVSPEGTLVINGTIGTNAPGFSRHVTITFSGGGGGDAKQIKHRRTDLKRKESPEEVIDRGSVVVGSASLKPGESQDVAVTVNNVTRHGTYEGTIEFYLSEQPEAKPVALTLSLRVAPKVDVRPPPSAAAQVAHCGPFPCSWSEWLPQNLVGNERGLLLDNQTPDSVAVVSQDLILRGEKTGRIVTGGDIRTSVPDGSLPGGRPAPVNLDILNRDALPPDRYVGTLRLGLKGADSPTSVGFTLDVREAPWWPLAVLLLGIVAGRIIRNMTTPEAVLQLKLMRRLQRLQQAVLNLRSERDREFLLRRLDDLRARIESASETEQGLTQELDKVEVTARLLRRLEGLRRETERLADLALKAEIMSMTDAAALALLNGNAGECERLITQIEIKLRQAHEDVTDDAAAVDIAGALDSAREAGAASTEARRVLDAPSPPEPGRPTRLLAALAGADLMSAGARFWVWRPIFFLLLLLLLVLLGLKTLYIDGGANFGVGGLYDYLGLFLWGLSAETAQRTLQNLSLPRP